MREKPVTIAPSTTPWSAATVCPPGATAPPSPIAYPFVDVHATTSEAFRPLAAPVIAARRARLTKYVTAILACCTALCAVALVRVAFARPADDLPRTGKVLMKASATTSLEAPCEELKSAPPRTRPTTRGRHR